VGLRWKVEAYELGLLIFTGNAGRWTSWRQVEKFYKKTYMQHGVITDRQITLVLENGEKWKFDSRFVGAEKMAELIDHLLLPELLVKAEERIRNGDMVDFTYVRLDRIGMRKPRIFFYPFLSWPDQSEYFRDWNELEPLKFEAKGHVYHAVLYCKGEQKPWFSWPAPSFPNLDVMSFLIEKMTRETA
jgi:hypothetical protein